MKVRRAGPDDAQALSALGRDTFSSAFGSLYPAEDLNAFLAETHAPDVYRRWLADPQADLWILEESTGAAVGYAALQPSDLPLDPMPEGALELSRLYVAPSVQGAGLGTVLLTAVLDRVAERGRPPLLLSVYSENYGAQRLYARHGFYPAGEYLFAVGRQRDREFIWRRD